MLRSHYPTQENGIILLAGHIKKSSDNSSRFSFWSTARSDHRDVTRSRTHKSRTHSPLLALQIRYSPTPWQTPYHFPTSTTKGLALC